MGLIVTRSRHLIKNYFDRQNTRFWLATFWRDSRKSKQKKNRDFFKFWTFTKRLNSMSRNRDESVSEDEEMEYNTPSSKRVKLANGSSSNGSGSNSTDEPMEEQTLKIDDDG